MKTSEYISFTIDRLPKGYAFTYAEFITEVNQKEAVIIFFFLPVCPNFKRERYTIAFVKQKNTITKVNIALLQLLDAIRYIKKKPDAGIEASCKRILAIIKKFLIKKSIHWFAWH